ncbi:hypothetical protein AB4Z10_13185 [Bosea sp. RAF48]|uniref:hypothetical protein n=2 Tax=Bosea TaxID=85413 RepID=UPI003F92DA72
MQMSDGNEATQAYEALLKQQYGFPDEWFYYERIDDRSGSGGVRAFDQPRLDRMPENLLKDRGLFKRLVLSVRDLSHAGSAIAFIEEEVDHDGRYPLAAVRKFLCYETTLIVSYCRPFSESRGDIPSLSYGALGIKLSPFTRALHDDLISKRNTIFAHSDASQVAYRAPVVMKGRDGAGEPFTTLFPPRFNEGIMLDYQRVQQAKILNKSLLGAVMARLQAMHVHFLDVLPSMDMDLHDPAPDGYDSA